MWINAKPRELPAEKALCPDSCPGEGTTRAGLSRISEAVAKAGRSAPFFVQL